MNKTKIIFVIYTPDGCSPKERSTVAYQKDQLKKNITYKTGVNPQFMEFHVHSLDQLDEEKIKKKC